MRKVKRCIEVTEYNVLIQLESKHGSNKNIIVGTTLYPINVNHISGGLYFIELHDGEHPTFDGSSIQQIIVNTDIKSIQYNITEMDGHNGETTMRGEDPNKVKIGSNLGFDFIEVRRNKI